MAKKTKIATLPESWFIDRIGKTIYATSKIYNGEVAIKDQQHAKYLCFIQKHQGYKFADMANVGLAKAFGASEDQINSINNP